MTPDEAEEAYRVSSARDGLAYEWLPVTGLGVFAEWRRDPAVVLRATMFNAAAARARVHGRDRVAVWLRERFGVGELASDGLRLWWKQPADAAVAGGLLDDTNR